MCIAYLSLGRHPEWPLFIAANRDEYHARSSRAAAPWPQAPDVIAGTDLVGGGTWLGVTRGGRFGFLTNYRDPASTVVNAPSRGQLVGNGLTGAAGPQSYINEVFRQKNRFNGFNLIVGDLTQAWYTGNRAPDEAPRRLAAGSYTLSNHLLDTVWPKTTRLRRALDEFPLDTLEKSTDAVFKLLHDTTPAIDADLPATGVPLARERLLSSPFIVSPDYGTRCSTVVAINAGGWGFLAEAVYNPEGSVVERNDWPFYIS
jgi:uncharacterized protein with NRDE domain